jgi:tetratricopeptide (TPR) repeat protein
VRSPDFRHIAPVLLLAVLLLAAACSTQKNTANSRWWHSFNAKYNTYYNGTLAYIDGSLEKETGNRDNFTEIIPLYTVGNKSSKEIGKGNFDKAIEKCEKAIKLHSIKRKPEWTKSRKKTEKDKEWLSRKEYNPFLWKAWLLMGRSQFHKGAFDEAASTFAYMSRLYQNQPAIYGRARAWLAKCYIEQGWMYDAEDVIRNMQRDSIHWRAQKEWDYTYADYYIHQGDYVKAIPYLQKVIKHEMRRKQKAREWFLLGQLQRELGRNDLALKAYKHVVRLSPPYEVEFNASIAETEVMAANQSKKMISKLKRMAASDNNKDYLDQVYYAIGNIYLSKKDTLQAITAYEKGNEKSTRNGVEKGVLLLKLGDLYWNKEKYSDARRCYGEAIGLLDKERKDYEQLSVRSKVLDELCPYTDAVYLQDSLQTLAKMSEKDRNAAIDRVIDALKKKEKEERDKLAEQNAQETLSKNGGMNVANQNQQVNRPTTTTQSTLWYFYNQMAVNQGKAAFQKKWGKRENVDNWQRINKTVVGTGTDGTGMTDAANDSLSRAEAGTDSLKQINDSAQNDPHKREYYLAQIPFSEEQVQASNVIIMDGLYHSGVIFKDKLDNLPLSEKALRRLVDHYPDYDHMDDAYYHLFLLYSRMNMPSVAESYLQRLKKDYPKSQWTTVLTDPYFKENARLGTHLEDSLYAATYEAFKADRYGEVNGNTRLSETRFPLGANRDKFIFINGLSKLNTGDANGCVADMRTVVEKYPDSKLSEMAGMIVNGVNAGKRLHGGKFDIGNVWDRRSAVLNDSDSIAARKFSVERNVDFVFLFVYKPDSVNENQLLFELAKFNFTSYLVRNFDVTIAEADGLHRMQVAGFRNYDEALQYARALYQQKNIIRRLGKSRSFIISPQNLELVGTQFSYDDYDKFYTKHFAPLKVSTFQLLTEPAEITTEKEQPPTPEEIDKVLDDGTIIDNGLDVTPPDNGTDITPESNNGGNGNTGTTVIPIETEPTGTDVNTGTTVIPTEENKPVTTEKPVQPAKPVTTEKPVTPEKPATTEKPATPTTPVTPPTAPVKAVTPVTTPPLTPATPVAPEKPKEVQPVEDGTTIVIDEPEKTDQPNTGTGTIIPVETPTVKTPVKTTPTTTSPKPKATTTSPSKKNTPTKTKGKTPAPAQPATPVKAVPKPTPKKTTDDDEIYFDDNSTPTKKPTTTKKDQKKKEKTTDLEDEYYDLEGF